jgi:hypothetical protein
MVLDDGDYTLALIGLDIHGLQAISFRTVSAERRLEKKRSLTNGGGGMTDVAYPHIHV